MLRANIKNISNFFIGMDTTENGLQRVADTIEESIFGVELTVKKGITERVLVTPPHIRLDEKADTSYRELVVGDFTFYEGYLSRPFFLPLYDALNGELLEDIDSLAEILEKDETMFMQWLFRRRFNWRLKAVEMYDSYLEGNDHPITFKLGRVVQEKTLGAINKIVSFNTERDYNDSVEAKVLDEGFQFQLRVGIQSERADVLKSVFEQILEEYDSYNAIRLHKYKDKNTEQHIKDCVLTHDTFYQILSRREILALFGGNTEERIVATPVVENKPVKSRAVVSNIIEILPEYPREEVHVRGDIVMNVAEALKRVGIIKTARLYNESVIAGIRLTVIQFDIPKGKTITHLEQKRKDIQAALGVPSLGIEQGDEPDTAKLTIPNEEPAIISLRELIEDPRFQKFSKENALAFIVGVDEINNPIYLSLSKLVHLLVAGTTGSGKSVFINSLAVTLLATHTPEQLKMIMIDPKEVELQQYDQFPHVEEVVTDMKDAVITLFKLTEEMDKRYSVFKEAGVKNITLYNQKMAKPMPYTVCIIDEYADLKDTNPEVEDFIGRLGQKARAAGIHLIIATQRPSADIISGRVKAVIPNAISFNLNSNTHYKTVFGTGIPYTLLGRGDGVMKIEGYPKEFQRFQSSIICPDEAQEEQVYEELAYHFFQVAKQEHIQSTKPEPEPEPEPKAEVAPEPEKPKPKPKPKKTDNLEEQFNRKLSEEEELIYKLKQIIADTRETRVAPLREKLGVKTSTMTELMGKLVEEGWLMKHDSKAKGYEIIISESILSEWKSN